MLDLLDLPTKIYADGADIETIRRLAENPLVQGFTTNPSLMRKAGVTDYRRFAQEVLEAAAGKPVSLEVLADELPEMGRQARAIASWGHNAWVKIPITNTRGESTERLILDLLQEGLAINVTALMRVGQIPILPMHHGYNQGPLILSVFAGRIADTGRQPEQFVAEFIACMRRVPDTRILWASPRQPYDLFRAAAVGCHLITLFPQMIDKLATVNKDLREFSLETVRMFYDDSRGISFEGAGE